MFSLCSELSLLSTSQTLTHLIHTAHLGSSCVSTTVDSWVDMSTKKSGILSCPGMLDFPRGSTYRDLYVLLVIFIKVVWKSIQGGGGEERRQETGLVLWLHVVLALVCLLMRQVGKVTELQSMLMGVAGLQERIPKEIPQEPCSIISWGQVGVPFATAYSVLIIRKEPLKIFWMNFFWVTVLPQPKWRGEKRQRS